MSGAVPSGSLTPWRSRDFRLVWGGGLVNDVGDWLLLVALPVYVFTETGSGTATATLFVIELVVAVLLGPIGGSLVDRWDLRRTLIWTNLVQAVTVLPLLAVTPDRIWPAFAVAAVQSVLTTLNNPAKTALLPRLVSPDQLVTANAAEATSRSLARLIGSPLGGVAVAVGGLETVVALDGLTFLAVAVATAFVRTDTSTAARRSGDAHAPGSGVRAGMRIIRREPRLRRLVSLTGLAAVAQGLFVVLFVVFVVEELDGGGAEVGVIRGTMAVGGIIGSVLIARWARRVDAARLLSIGLLGMGGVAFLFWNAPAVTTALWVAVALFATSGLPGAALQVGAVTSLQTASAPEVLGRVVGVIGATEAAGNALGSIAAGVLVDRVRLSVLLNAQVAIYLLCGVLASWWATRRAPSPGGAGSAGST
jgi:predicted MFS family arabinose efflux permease